MSNWREDALCAQIGGDLFLSEDRSEWEAAKRICQGCDVRQECFDFGLKMEQQEGGAYGIWGGSTHRMRKLALKKMRRREREALGRA